MHVVIFILEWPRTAVCWGERAGMLTDVHWELFVVEDRQWASSQGNLSWYQLVPAQSSRA